MSITNNSSTKTVVHKVGATGYQQRTAFLDPTTGEITCYRAGGIRYARPLDLPKQRWRRAQAVATTTTYGTREQPTDCTGLAAECPQPGGRVGALASEDCLQLNVWMPAESAPAGGWPVFFYIRELFPSINTKNSIPEAKPRG